VRVNCLRRSLAPEARRWLLPLGSLAAVGSVGGFMLLRLAAGAPAALVFPVSAVASLLGANIVFVAPSANERRRPGPA
jgi:hypothetical protein